MLYEFYFEGRKPSVKQVMAKVNEGLRQNAQVIEVSWGENMITLQTLSYAPNEWHGYGWIKGISGHDIATKLNVLNAMAKNPAAKALMASGRLDYIHLGA